MVERLQARAVFRIFLPRLIATVAACCAAHSAIALGDALVQGFQAPPQAAKPRVWWHWIDGNVTEEGARLDLEWLQRIGIGGVQNFDAAFDSGVALDAQLQVAQPLTYLSPQWRQALLRSVEHADQLGLEFTIASSPGFSETGGPWVRPHEAMKKLVWSETHLTGGKPFKGRLASPPRITGAFQDIPLRGMPNDRSSKEPAYYADVAAIAFRRPSVETSLRSPQPTIASSAGAMDVARLSDGDLASTISLPFGEGPQAWVQWTFAQPQRIQAMTTVFGRSSAWDSLLEPDPQGWLEASIDGRNFRKVADIPIRHDMLQSSALQQTVAFSPVVAQVFRLVLQRPGSKSGPAELLGLAAPRVAHQIAELALHSDARVNRFEDKAGYSNRPIVASDDTPAIATREAVRKHEIIDLTRRMRADGSLDWQPPAGEWIVLRFGYSLTGRTNRPASLAATGLEVDKLNRGHVRTYIETYLGEYRKTLGPGLIGRRGLQYVLTDSFEVGMQNWTDDMLAQFKQRRAYDALPWLPVLTGRVVESAAASDRFLWDFRKTLADLIADAHYGQISEALRERGLGRYGESHEHLRAFIGDGMEAKKTAEIPMGAMWAAPPAGFGYTKAGMDADIRESASVAHIYGKNLVAAESFTAFGNPYGFAPQDLKPIADREMAMGANRFVIHTSAHQPDSKPGPGMSFGPFGQWFTRKETWAEQAGGWISYLARSSYLLQQGRFVADVVYLYGEDQNITSLFHASAAPVPDGYSFDFINADALLNELSVKNGRLMTRKGMEYRVLALDASTQRLSLPVLRKIRDLVHAGAAVVGNRPIATPSLADDEARFRAIVSELWGDTPHEHAVGSGKVVANRSLAEALQSLQVSADAVFMKPADADFRFVHRALEDGDIYFISHSAARRQKVEVSFRVSGKKPELWRADAATITPMSYRIEHERTVVSLLLEPNDAVFVVFRQPADVQHAIVAEPTAEVLADVAGPWTLSFEPNRGAPASARFDSLYSWTDSTDTGVKYFSGTATYSKTVRADRSWLAGGAQVHIDLGDVKNLAEVLVNGRSMGVLWKAPFKADITSAMQAGENRIEIKVSNLWPNRLIGDKQPGARQVALTTFNPFTADSPLMTSGLLGPVTLLRVSVP